MNHLNFPNAAAAPLRSVNVTTLASNKDGSGHMKACKSDEEPGIMCSVNIQT